MKREIALINEKDVTTDWIESVFDSDNFVRDTNLIIGMLNHCAVQAVWSSNTITWLVSEKLGRGDSIYAFMLLEQRLRSFESEEQNIYSVMERGDVNKFEIIQRFYFKEEES